MCNRACTGVREHPGVNTRVQQAGRQTHRRAHACSVPVGSCTPACHGHGTHACRTRTDTHVCARDTHTHTCTRCTRAHVCRTHRHTRVPLPAAAPCTRACVGVAGPGWGGHSACAAGACGDESRRAGAALSHRRRRGARPGEAGAHACAHVTRAGKGGAWPFKGRGRVSCPPPGGARRRRGSSAPSPGPASSSPGPAASASGAGPGSRRCHGNGAGGAEAVLGSPGRDLGSPRRGHGGPPQRGL